MKTEIKLNDSPSVPPIILPRLLINGIIKGECVIILQTGWCVNPLYFYGTVLHSNIPGYTIGLTINPLNIHDWKEFEHTLTLSNK
jgi:hypothetical protein